MLHAVFHRALVRAYLVITALHQSPAALVHAFGDFVVFHAGLHIGCALRLDKFRFERDDFFRVEELHDIHGFTWTHGVQR